MAEHNLSISDLSVNDWAKQVTALGVRAGGQRIFFEMSCSIGFVCASGFRCRVDAREIHIGRQSEAHEESPDDALFVFLPRVDSAHFRRYDLGGETIGFSVVGLAGRTGSYMELRLATTEVFLEIVASASPD